MLRYCKVVVNLLIGPSSTDALIGLDAPPADTAAPSTASPAESATSRAAALDVDGRILLRHCRLKMQLLKTYAELFDRNQNESSRGLPDESIALSVHQPNDPSTPAAPPVSDFEASLVLSPAERSLLSGLFRLSARTLTKDSISSSASGASDGSQRSDLSKLNSVRFEEDSNSPSDIAGGAAAAEKSGSRSYRLTSSSKSHRLVSVCGFLASFEISRKTQTDEERIDSYTSSVSTIPVRLSINKNEPRFHKVAALFFASEFVSSSSSSSSTTSSLEDSLLRCGIEAEFLLDLLLYAWLRTASVTNVDTESLKTFTQLLTIVTRIAGESDISTARDEAAVSNEEIGDGEGPLASAPSVSGASMRHGSSSTSLSTWWSRMRAACADAAWRSLPAALAAAVVGRAVAENRANELCRRKAEELGDEVKSEEDWVSVDEDKAAWTLLINRLQDCLAIAVLFSFRSSPSSLKTAMRKSEESADSSSEDLVVVDELSVSAILKAGRGGIPELVARWVAKREVTVDQLLCDDADAKKSQKTSLSRGSFDDGLLSSSQEAVGVRVEVEDLETISTVKEALEKLVRKRVVHGLKWDVLAANCCWENAVLWNKFVEGHLPASLNVSWASSFAAAR